MLLFQFLGGPLEPLGRPFVHLDAVAQDCERAGIGAVLRALMLALTLDLLPKRPQLRGARGGFRGPLPRDLRRPGRIDRPGEEELQQALVAELEDPGGPSIQSRAARLPAAVSLKVVLWRAPREESSPVISPSFSSFFSSG